jgi:hypothetical protein
MNVLLGSANTAPPVVDEDVLGVIHDLYM